LGCSRWSGFSPQFSWAQFRFPNKATPEQKKKTTRARPKTTVPKPTTTHVTAGPSTVPVAFGTYDVERAFDLLLDTSTEAKESVNVSALRGFDETARTPAVLFRQVFKFDSTDMAESVSRNSRQSIHICVGVAMSRRCSEAARMLSSDSFTLIDGASDSRNVMSITFANRQIGFLAGYTAATVSKVGHIGILTSERNPDSKPYEQGFSAGANYAKPGISIDIRYTADTNANGNPADNAKAIAGEMFITSDVVFQHLGRNGLQVARAARATGVSPGSLWVIGSDTDLRETTTVEDGKEFVLTSVVKRFDRAVFEEVMSVAATRAPKATIIRKDETAKTRARGIVHIEHNIESGGVEFGTGSTTFDNLRPTLDLLKRAIIHGDVKA
jgi:basic membrane lipoprotein Med (substrate-binding protein (PBP1-ABC) superfamily)